ncbi:MAG TPA: hypothetical protein VM680_03225 [Verrucomicrobiae bacterium]|nr:hypothetical protein [Verrucomicrobiae bacterium]
MKKLFCTLVVSCAMAVQAAQTFYPSDNFSLEANPNGVWTYGFSKTLGGELILFRDSLPFFAVFSRTGLNRGLHMWYTNDLASAFADPLIALNPLSATTFNSGDSSVEPGGLSLHPGPNGEFAVLRFTAPRDATYTINGAFYGQNRIPTSTDAHVLINGQSVFDALVETFGQAGRQNFTITRVLTKGAAIDFAVGVGQNGNFNSDLTGLDLEITQVTDVFDARSDFSTTTNPNAGWTYGYRADLGSEFVPFDQVVKRGAMDYWISGSGPDPGVGHNPTKLAQVLNEIIFKSHQLAVHPGPNGEYAVVRWTAPAAGQFFTLANFVGEGGMSIVDVHILKNGQSIFDDSINGPTKRASFSSVLTAAAGDTLDFAVGRGADSNYNSDTTGVDVQLRPVSQAASTNLTIRPAVELFWPTQNGDIYQLQSAPKIDAGNWQNVHGPFQSGGNSTNFFEVMSNPALFYRLLKFE